MRPHRFELEQPQSLAAALAALQSTDRSHCVMAGGQSLLKQLRERSIMPARVIDISAVPELNFVRRGVEGLTLGALVRLATLTTDPPISTHCPALAEAAARVGDVQIRSRATLGGNLCSGWSSDLGVVIAAAHATITIGRRGSSRIIDGASFMQAGDQALAPDELVQAICVPDAAGSVFEKLSRRAADPVLVSAAAFVWKRGENVDIGLAAGGVHPHPLRLIGIEQALATEGLRKTVLARVLDQCAGTLLPPNTAHASAEYRRQIFPVMVTRALRRALASAGCGDLS